MFAMLVTSNSPPSLHIHGLCWYQMLHSTALIEGVHAFLSNLLQLAVANHVWFWTALSVCVLKHRLYVCVLRHRWRSSRARGKGRRIWNRTWWGGSKCSSTPSNKRGKTRLCVIVSIIHSASCPDVLHAVGCGGLIVKGLHVFALNAALMWCFLGLQGKAPEAEDRKWPESRRQETRDRGRPTYV